MFFLIELGGLMYLWRIWVMVGLLGEIRLWVLKISFCFNELEWKFILFLICS